MAQPLRQADVHQDELYPPNKHYALMDANKKIDLDNPLCPNERKIMAKILQNHPLRFSIATSSSPIESTQRTHRRTSVPRSPNPNVDEGESSAQRKSTVIRLRIPPRRSTRLTSPTSVPTIAAVEDMTFKDTIHH
ncbi:hypothetical protein Tco_0657048 [Tanacetum coccineum]|uniref:Uncharacterized protein n=1 Tax=Tanacetum coccineum TaxID=301880 RepID=A0ABQ4XAQ1_9ASTR